MSIFNGKDGWAKTVNKFVEENSLQEVDKDYDDALRRIAISVFCKLKVQKNAMVFYIVLQPTYYLI